MNSQKLFLPGLANSSYIKSWAIYAGGGGGWLCSTIKSSWFKGTGVYVRATLPLLTAISCELLKVPVLMLERCHTDLRKKVQLGVIQWKFIMMTKRHGNIWKYHVYIVNPLKRFSNCPSVFVLSSRLFLFNLNYCISLVTQGLIIVFKRYLWAVETSQSVKSLSCKQEDLNSIFRTHIYQTKAE